MNLTKRQKSFLVNLARRAFNRSCSIERGHGRTPDSSYRAFDAWRRDQVRGAVHKHGLRCCSDADFDPLAAHFQTLLGETGKALTSYLNQANFKRNQAEAVLWREMKLAGLSPNYVEAIALDKWGKTLLGLEEHQLWQLTFTVRNRAAARRRKEKENHDTTKRPGRT